MAWLETLFERIDTMLIGIRPMLVDYVYWSKLKKKWPEATYQALCESLIRPEDLKRGHAWSDARVARESLRYLRDVRDSDADDKMTVSQAAQWIKGMNHQQIQALNLGLDRATAMHYAPWSSPSSLGRYILDSLEEKRRTGSSKALLHTFFADTPEKDWQASYWESCAQKLSIPPEDTKGHDWHEQGAFTYELLVACQQRGQDPRACMQHLQGLSNMSQMQVIALGVSREATMGHPWEQVGATTLDLLEKASQEGADVDALMHAICGLGCANIEQMEAIVRYGLSRAQSDRLPWEEAAKEIKQFLSSPLSIHMSAKERTDALVGLTTQAHFLGLSLGVAKEKLLALEASHSRTLSFYVYAILHACEGREDLQVIGPLVFEMFLTLTPRRWLKAYETFIEALKMEAMETHFYQDLAAYVAQPTADDVLPLIQSIERGEEDFDVLRSMIAAGGTEPSDNRRSIKP